LRHSSTTLLPPAHVALRSRRFVPNSFNEERACQQGQLLLLSEGAGQQKTRHRLDVQGEPTCLVHHRGKTVTKPLSLSRLGLPLSEKQIPQVVETLESGGKPKEALERVAMRPRQVRYTLRSDSNPFGSVKCFPISCSKLFPGEFPIIERAA